jgi:hypothetical protein
MADISVPELARIADQVAQYPSYGHRWIVTGRPRPDAPTGADQVWSHDFSE